MNEDLSGRWRVAAPDAAVDRMGVDPEFDDSSWAHVEVPGHWGEAAPFADHPGPLLYRRAFTNPDHTHPFGSAARHWLRFDGVMSEAEVWLDGRYLGDTVGYFAVHRFEITSFLNQRRRHLLAVDVSCPPGGDEQARRKTSLTGSLQTGPLAPGGNPGGIWQPVGIDTTGPVSILHSRLLCREANPDRATVQIRLVVDAARPSEVRIDTSFFGPDQTAGGPAPEPTVESQHHSLAEGENRLEWEVVIDRPQLWWPAVLCRPGPHEATDRSQALYHVVVSVVTHDGGAELVSDSRRWRTGLRTAEMSGLVWRINGERLFLKSIAYGPPRRFLRSVPRDQLIHDVQSIGDAGLDMIRISGHIGRSEIYQQADALGLLIWQDLPLIGGYSSKVRRSIKTLIREAVDLVGHHPSVVAWAGHCQPNGEAVPVPDHNADDHPTTIGRQLARHLLPSWNRSVLDSIVGRELEQADPSRPVIARSGSLPHPGEPRSSDARLWLGWRTGTPAEAGELFRRWPRLATFPSGIGSQSVSVRDWPADAPTWPGAELGSFRRYLPRRAYPDGQSWAAATRAYQGDVIRAHIEAIRRLKYRPSGGFCVTALADARPEGGFGVVDFERRAKPALDVLIDACRPVIVVADQLPAVVVPGQPLAPAIHVVSDLRHPVEMATVTARVTGGGEPGDGPWMVTRSWAGSIDADSCCFIGRLEFLAPAHTGPLVVDLQLEAEEIVATNRYRTVVIPGAEAMGPTPSRP